MADLYDAGKLQEYLQRVRGQGITPSFTDVATSKLTPEEDPLTFYLDNPPEEVAMPYTTLAPTIDPIPKGNPWQQYEEYNRYQGELNTQLTLDMQRGKEAYFAKNFANLDAMGRQLETMSNFGGLTNPETRKSYSEVLALHTRTTSTANVAWETEKQRIFGERMTHLQGITNNLETIYKPQGQSYQALNIKQGFTVESVQESPLVSALFAMYPDQYETPKAVAKAMVVGVDPTMESKTALAAQVTKPGFKPTDAYEYPNVPTGMSTEEYYQAIKRSSVANVKDPVERQVVDKTMDDLEILRKQSLVAAGEDIATSKAPYMMALRTKVSKEPLERERVRLMGMHMATKLAEYKTDQAKYKLADMFTPGMTASMTPPNAEAVIKVMAAYDNLVATRGDNQSSVQLMKLARNQVEAELGWAELETPKEFQYSANPLQAPLDALLRKEEAASPLAQILVSIAPLIRANMNKQYEATGLFYTDMDFAMMGNAEVLATISRGRAPTSTSNLNAL